MFSHDPAAPRFRSGLRSRDHAVTGHVLCQFTEEKLGQAEKTELDAHLENLLVRAENTKQWTERIMKQTEVLLQPNPSKNTLLTLMNLSGLTNKMLTHRPPRYRLCAPTPTPPPVARKSSNPIYKAFILTPLSSRYIFRFPVQRRHTVKKSSCRPVMRPIHPHLIYLPQLASVWKSAILCRISSKGSYRFFTESRRCTEE